MAPEHLPPRADKTTSCSHVWDLGSKQSRIGYRCMRCCDFLQVADLRAFESELTPEIAEAELTAFIRKIESGEVRLNPSQRPTEVREGPVEYCASNGWALIVFKDRSRWDYLARIDADDGRVVTFMTMPRSIRSYRPSRRVAVERYAFDGPTVVRQRRAG